MNIGALPRRCRPFSRTESAPLKSQDQYKTQRRGASALFPIAHEKPVFVVGSWSLGPRHVLEINERNCGSENKKDLGEDTFPGGNNERGEVRGYCGWAHPVNPPIYLEQARSKTLARLKVYKEVVP